MAVGLEVCRPVLVIAKLVLLTSLLAHSLTQLLTYLKTLVAAGDWQPEAASLLSPSE